MGEPARRQELTYADYVALEAESQERHAFHDGEMFAMAGGTPAHARRGARVAGLLDSALADRPCFASSSDQRVRIDDENAVYPDAVVVCPPVATSPTDPHAITNPTVIVEVMSPSSAPWDRDGKFKLYRALPSLQHYVLVASTHWEVDHFRRLPDGAWRLSSHGPGDHVDLDAVDVRLAVDEVYAKIEAAGGPARTAARPAGPAKSPQD